MLQILTQNLNATEYITQNKRLRERERRQAQINLIGSSYNTEVV